MIYYFTDKDTRAGLGVTVLSPLHLNDPRTHRDIVASKSIVVLDMDSKYVVDNLPVTVEGVRIIPKFTADSEITDANMRVLKHCFPEYASDIVKAYMRGDDDMKECIMLLDEKYMWSKFLDSGSLGEY